MNNEEYAFRKNLKFMLSQLENVKDEAEVTLHNSSTNGMTHFIIRKGEENYIVLFFYNELGLLISKKFLENEKNHK